MSKERVERVVGYESNNPQELLSMAMIDPATPHPQNGVITGQEVWEIVTRGPGTVNTWIVWTYKGGYRHTVTSRRITPTDGGQQ